MILTLAEAQTLDPNITQDDLDAFETSIRALTNNNFQNFNVRISQLSLSDKTITATQGTTNGMRVGDTIEVNGTLYNNGIYTIASLTAQTITVNSAQDFIAETAADGIATLVQYPADIKRGVRKLIEYDVQMAGKAGIKSESISRMSVTYYDVNAAENTDGYPKAMLDFISKYEKMRWR